MLFFSTVLALTLLPFYVRQTHAHMMESGQDVFDWIFEMEKAESQSGRPPDSNGVLQIESCSNNLFQVMSYQERYEGEMQGSLWDGHEIGDKDHLKILSLVTWQACMDIGSMRKILYTGKGISGLDVISKHARNNLRAWRIWCMNSPHLSKRTAGWTVAHFACDLHLGGVLEMLWEHGYDLGKAASQTKDGADYRALLPAHVCASSGYDEGIRSLSSWGYILDPLVFKGESSLDKAVLNNRVSRT
jgi:hypothetical protein